MKVYDPSGESTLPLVPKKRKEREENEEQAVPQKAKKAKIEIKGWFNGGSVKGFCMVEY